MLFSSRFGNYLSNAAAPQTDPRWADVILLLKGEGSNGSTTITDSSSLNLAHSGNVGVSNSTSQKKFQDGSVYFTGVSHRLDYASNARWNFASGHWTFECWVMLPNGFDGYGVCQISKGGSDRGNFYFDATNMQVYTGSGSYSAAHGGITTGQWYHMAWVKQSGVNKPKIFKDGVELTVSGSPSWSSATQAYQIGRNDGGQHSTKYIDELRITKGTNAGCARYLANFTPPTAPFPTSA